MREVDKLHNNLMIFTRDYLPIVGTSAVVYYYLCMGKTFLYSRFNKKSLMLLLNVTEDMLEQSLDILKTCNLIKRPSKSRDNVEFYTYTIINEVKSLSIEDKYALISLLFENKVIDNFEKEFKEKTVREIEVSGTETKTEIKIESKNENTASEGVRDVNLLDKNGMPNPDTFLGLLFTYYNMLSEKYKQIVKSSNIVKEAHILSSVSKMYNDTPDNIRKMFKWIIDNNKFDLVCTLNLYPVLRKQACYHLFSEQEKFETSNYKEGEEEMEFIKTVYDFYHQKGQTNDIIRVSRLYPNYSKESVDKFFDSLEKNNGQ